MIYRELLLTFLLCATGFAAVVDNVTVNTSGAPTNYVVSYDLNVPSGEWYYVEAVISADDGASYSFALDKQIIAGAETADPNLPVRVSLQDNGTTINAFMNDSGTKTFSLIPTRMISIPQARIRVVARKVDPEAMIWEQVSASTPFYTYDDFLVLSNKMWVFERGKVFSSADGINWTEETAYAPYGSRNGMRFVAFDDKLWAIAGSGHNDVWSSTDGTNWTQVTANAPWSARGYHQCVVFENKIFLIGGHCCPK